MKAVECADYDSMGNQGRFPMKKKYVQKSFFSKFLEKLFNLF